MSPHRPRRLVPNSRAGVELAISTVVVLILGIVIVGAGLALVWNLVQGGGDYAEEITALQRQRLSELYGNGQLVAVTPQSVEVRAGDSTQVALGIRSILDAEETFYLSVVGTGPDRQPVPIGAQEGSWRVVHFADTAVRPDMSGEEVINVVAPETAPRGTYTFVITVKRADGSIYESPRFFTVRVR